MSTENNGTPTATTSATPAEPSMAEYGAMREAAMRGQAKPDQAVQAVAPEQKDPAAATEDDESLAAAATGENGDDAGTPPAAAADDDPGVEIEEAHPAKKGIQKRFSEMTAKQKELQAKADQAQATAEAATRRAEQAEADMQKLRAQAEAAQAAVPHVIDAADDPAPRRDEYEDPDEFTAALSAHATRKEIRRSTQAAKEIAEELAAAAKQVADTARQEQMNAAIAELHTTFNKRVAEVKPDYPDYDEKVTHNTELVMRNDIFFTIEKAADSPHILYHVATNPQELDSLNKMHPQDAAIRIGELQAELRVARKPKVTKAAAPIKPVGNRASPVQKSPNEESMEEYAARRASEDKASANKRTRII